MEPPRARRRRTLLPSDVPKLLEERSERAVQTGGAVRASKALRTTRFLVAFAILCSLLTGCRSFQPVSTGILASEVSLGDRVRLITTDGLRREFHVTFVGPESIGGESVRIALEDVVYAELDRVDVRRTVGLGVLGTIGGAMVFIAVAVTAGVVILAAGA